MAWLDQLMKPFRGEAAPALALGVFGKHPGWDDHLDDFGLETEALLAARQWLYVQGIGGVVESGAWEKGEGGGEVPFGHLGLWFGEGELLLARLWASQDRKGRSRYPMIVCAQVTGLEPGSALELVLPALAALEQECRETASAEAVHGLIEKHRQQLRTRLASPTSPTPPLPRAEVAARLGLSPQSEAWARLLYAAETQLAAFTVGKIPEAAKRITQKLGSLPALPQHLRLPLGKATPGEAALFWQALLTHLLHATAPLLFLQPHDQPWIDVIAGCPGVKQLVCLRASAAAIPLITEVPYLLPEGFAEKAARVYREFCAVA